MKLQLHPRPCGNPALKRDRINMIDEFNIFAGDNSPFSHNFTSSDTERYSRRDFQNSIHRAFMRTVCVCATLQKSSNKILNSIKINSSNFLRNILSMLFAIKLHSKYAVCYQTIKFDIKLSNYIVSMLFAIKLHSKGFYYE